MERQRCRRSCSRCYAVDSAANGEEGLTLAKAFDYDAIVLDLMLPRVNGWDLLRELRRRKATPVLIVTARDTLQDRVLGLDIGGDDYLVKPFELKELQARLRALIRRAAGKARPLIEIGDVVIDTAARRVARQGIPVALTAREYALIEYLALHRRQLVTRAMIYERIFEDDDTLPNLIEVYVSNLRKKLGKDVIVTRLEEAFGRQSRFTADASHELRTPLAVLSSHLEVALSRGSLDADQRETLEACRRAVRRMNSLVDALLLLARADAGDLALVRQPCDLASIVEECVEMLRPLADEKSVSLALSADACDLEADPALLGQLVMNLLTNAIHYNCPGGSVQVAVRTEQDAAVLVVEDSGPGIAPQDQSHLFERFYRVDKARSREGGGNGLGLAIVKSIVDAHRGEICVASRPGQGSRFTVRLPTNAAAAAAG